jgi:DNA/RNA endonuclease YhcR with UshA esterase domain
VLTIAQGGIAELSPFSKGLKAEVTDSSGSIILLIWQNVLEEMSDRYYLRPGIRVQITGEIDEYEGTLEIVPRHGDNVAVLDEIGQLPVESRNVNEITPSDEGRIFTVSGNVTLIEGDGWLKVLLDDGVGEIVVFVPERIVPYLPKGIGPGAKLDVTGEVDIYNGVLEIIPLAGVDVRAR